MSTQFTASGDTLSRNDTTLAAATPFSLVARVRKTASSDNGMAEINFGSGWVAAFTTFGTDMFIFLYDGSSSAEHIFTYSTNTWYHLALTADGTNVRCYVNGALQATVAWALTGMGASVNWVFGQSNVIEQDVEIYSAALSTADVWELYQKSQPTRRTNLVASYPMFAGSAARLIDYSGNAKSLTSAGTPTDGAVTAPVPWGTGHPQLILASAISATATGNVRQQGSATATLGLADSASGQIRQQASATATAAFAAAASGGIRQTGIANNTVSVSTTASGLTVMTGAAVASSSAGGAPGLPTGYGNASVRSRILHNLRRALR